MARAARSSRSTRALNRCGTIIVSRPTPSGRRSGGAEHVERFSPAPSIRRTLHLDARAGHDRRRRDGADLSQPLLDEPAARHWTSASVQFPGGTILMPRAASLSAVRRRRCVPDRNACAITVGSSGRSARAGYGCGVYAVEYAALFFRPGSRDFQRRGRMATFALAEHYRHCDEARQCRSRAPGSRRSPSLGRASFGRPMAPRNDAERRCCATTNNGASTHDHAAISERLAR